VLKPAHFPKPDLPALHLAVFPTRPASGNSYRLATNVAQTIANRGNPLQPATPPLLSQTVATRIDRWEQPCQVWGRRFESSPAPRFIRDFRRLRAALRGHFCFPALGAKAGEARGKRKVAGFQRKLRQLPTLQLALAPRGAPRARVQAALSAPALWLF
jgi:hypothetical protein